MTTAVSLEHRRVTWVSVAVVALRTFQERVRAPVKLLEQYVPTSVRNGCRNGVATVGCVFDR